MNNFNDFFKQIADFFANSWFNLLAGILVLVIGVILIKLLCKLMLKIIYSTKIDNATGGFFVTIIRIVLYIGLIFGCAAILGIDGNSFLVAFSSVALAIGLALKDSLANIANGLIIIAVKPFKKGDHIQIGDTEGTVKKISILTTEIISFDNKKIVLPNSIVVSNQLINHTANPTRRIDFTYCVSYDSDMRKVKAVLNDVLKNFKYVLNNPEPIIYMEAHNSSSVDFKVRFWVDTADYWNAFRELNEEVFYAFKDNNINIPFNQLDVNLKMEKGE